MSKLFTPTNPEIARYGEITGVCDAELSKVFFIDGQNPLVVKEPAGKVEKYARGRLALEAKTLGILDHPQIPQLVEDKTDEEQPYFSMTRIKGDGNFSRLHESSDPMMAASIVYSALNALRTVHETAVLHRDVKTSNLIIQATGRAALIDFGIAVPLNGNGTKANEEISKIYEREIQRYERAGYPGTSDYMSPEQVLARKLDEASDIYSMGVVFYELLYGKRPYSKQGPEDELRIISRDDAEDIIALSVLALSAKTKERRARRNDLRIRNRHVYGEINFDMPEGRDIPKELVAITERATQREPRDRYGSAEEMQEDIARYLKENSKLPTAA